MIRPNTLRKSLQTTSASPYRTQVQPVASFLVCSLIFIEYKLIKVFSKILARQENKPDNSNSNLQQNGSFLNIQAPLLSTSGSNGKGRQRAGPEERKSDFLAPYSFR